MKNRKLLILVSVLLLTGGISLAYFVGTAYLTGNGASASGTTATINGVTVKVDGNIEFNDLNIYPGHQNISSIKVTATGEGEFIPYSLVWSGTNSLNTSLNYKVYKTTSLVEASTTCNKITDIVNGAQHLSEECTISNLDSLGSIISSGTIASTTSEVKIILSESEFITASSTGETVYYYVVLEYPNEEGNQNSDIGGTFNGELKVEANDAVADITIAKVYIEDGNGEYQESDNIPGSEDGYVLNEENSTCTNNAVPIWDSEDWSLKVNSLTSSGTECNLYFDEEVKASEVILANKTISTRTDFSTTLENDTTGIMYSAEDDDGTSYYFAGAPTDNWVKFGGFYWRIVRINGDGTIRLIYNGTSTAATGDGTQIGTSAFNESYNDNMYAGYMYSSGSAHGLETSSTIKGILDNWYNSNLTNYASNIDKNAGFCNDRTTYSGTGIGNDATKFSIYSRLYLNKSPILKCIENSDLFTPIGASKGNKTLTYPIGLITADEVAFAGSIYGNYETNTNYYLYTNEYYWTMTPYNSETSYVNVIAITAFGAISLPPNNVADSAGVRPVINLRANVKLTGTGISSDPYVVVGAE